MDDLIEAMQIFRKYTGIDSMGCEHDVMYVYVDYDSVSPEDKERLEDLSFEESEFNGFQSYRFGSA